jgi:hypothetical protein
MSDDKTLPSFRDMNIHEPEVKDYGHGYQHGYTWGWNDCLRWIIAERLRVAPKMCADGGEDIPL